MRNLKKGYTRQDLGISYVKEQEALLRSNFSQVHHRIRENWERTQSQVRDRLHQIEHRVEETLGDLRNRAPGGLQGYVASFGGTDTPHLRAPAVADGSDRATTDAEVLVGSGSALLAESVQ